jgi:hypothetical protein
VTGIIVAIIISTPVGPTVVAVNIAVFAICALIGRACKRS